MERFTTVGGLRIRRGKTHKMVAEQLNRIGERCAGLVAEAAKPGLSNEAFWRATGLSARWVRSLSRFAEECGIESDLADAGLTANWLDEVATVADYVVVYSICGWGAQGGVLAFEAIDPDAAY